MRWMSNKIPLELFNQVLSQMRSFVIENKHCLSTFPSFVSNCPAELLQHFTKVCICYRVTCLGETRDKVAQKGNQKQKLKIIVFSMEMFVHMLLIWLQACLKSSERVFSDNTHLPSLRSCAQRFSPVFSDEATSEWWWRGRGRLFENDLKEEDEIWLVNLGAEWYEAGLKMATAVPYMPWCWRESCWKIDYVGLCCFQITQFNNVSKINQVYLHKEW